jgi:hypothetical protein
MNHYRSFGRIVLPCALIVAACAGIACGQLWGDPNRFNNVYKPWGKYGPTFTVTNPMKIARALNGRSPARPNRRIAHRPAPRVAPSRATRFDDLNLSVNMPNGPWVKSDPKKTGSRARFIISRSDPTIVISLAGERAGTEAGDTNDSLLAESQAKMRSFPGGAVEPGERQLSAAGIQGVAYEATVTDGQYTTYYSLWVAAHHGYNYKLAVYGDQQHKPAIDEAMRDFLRGIQQIQPTRVARGNGNYKPLTR